MSSAETLVIRQSVCLHVVQSGSVEACIFRWSVQWCCAWAPGCCNKQWCVTSKQRCDHSYQGVYMLGRIGVAVLHS
jgi:hypothetical protein